MAIVSLVANVPMSLVEELWWLGREMDKTLDPSTKGSLIKSMCCGSCALGWHTFILLGEDLKAVGPLDAYSQTACFLSTVGPHYNKDHGSMKITVEPRYKEVGYNKTLL